MVKPKQPSLTADSIIVYQGKIVLVRRKHAPYKDFLALPGGFVEIGETVEEAAIREAKEETGLDIDIIKLVGVYSNKDRDPRSHTVAVCYAARSTYGEPKAGSDASEIKFVDISGVPELAFDHNIMIEDAKFEKLL